MCISILPICKMGNARNTWEFRNNKLQWVPQFMNLELQKLRSWLRENDFRINDK